MRVVSMISVLLDKPESNYSAIKLAKNKTKTRRRSDSQISPTIHISKIIKYPCPS